MIDWKKSPLTVKAAVIGSVFLLLVLLITSIFGKKGLIEIAKARRIYAALQLDIERLREEKARLEKEIAALESDPKAVEREARDKLWLAKPGEKIIIKKKT